MEQVRLIALKLIKISSYCRSSSMISLSYSSQQPFVMYNLLNKFVLSHSYFQRFLSEVFKIITLLILILTYSKWYKSSTRNSYETVKDKIICPRGTANSTIPNILPSLIHKIYNYIVKHFSLASHWHSTFCNLKQIFMLYSN